LLYCVNISDVSQMSKTGRRDARGFRVSLS
jgi:hypothetical protein